MASRAFVSQLRNLSMTTFEALLLRPYLSLLGEQVQERFAIVGNARTGSNYLLDGLKSSSSIRMYHEIFADHNREIGKDFESVLSTLFRKEKKGTRLVGFKVFYNHLTDAEWDRFAAQRSFKIIHLTRSNRLRTIISTDIAFKTGQWTSSRRSGNAPPGDRVVTLDPSTLIERIERIRAGEDITRERFMDRPMLEVVYETMVAQPQETFRRVGEFLGVSDIDPSHIGIRRQNPERLAELIANYEDVRRLLTATEYASYLDE
jgi:LPS sulfotransferase NodH